MVVSNSYTTITTRQIPGSRVLWSWLAMWELPSKPPLRGHRQLAPAISGHKTMTLNSIALRRNAILVPKDSGSTSKAFIATFNLNLQELGYTLSPGVIKALEKTSGTAVKALAKDTLAALAEARGADVKYKPMYPNFPEQVMEASDAELYLNAILHYWSFVVSDLEGDPNIIWLPKYRRVTRESVEKVKLTILTDLTLNELGLVGEKIATSNTSISAADKSDLAEIVKAGLLHV